MLSTGFDPATTGIAYQWKLNGTDITGSDSSTHKATRAGKYTCVITVSGVCSTTTLPLTVKINPLPTPAITYIGGILRTETYYKSYQWYQNTKAIVGATTYKITPHVSADFSVIVVDTNTCVSKASVYPIDKLATNELSFGNTPVIYPNPATGVVHISYPVRTNIVVSSIDGQSLLKQNAANEIDISSLANSLYIISLFDKDGNPLLEQKLLKQ